MNPPIQAVAVVLVLVPLRFHPFGDPLIDLREAVPDFFRLQPEEVDHLHPARAVGEVLSVSVFADVIFDTGNAAKAEGFRLVRSDDESSPVKLHAGTTDSGIRAQGNRPRRIHSNGKVGAESPFLTGVRQRQSLRRFWFPVRPSPRRLPLFPPCRRSLRYGRRPRLRCRPMVIGKGEAEGKRGKGSGSGILPLGCGG